MHIYFILAIGTDTVKIGYAKDINRRLRAMRSSCPMPLIRFTSVKIPKDFGEMAPVWENICHKRFASCRVRGEWFKLTDEMIGFLEVVNATGIAGFMEYLNIPEPNNWHDVDKEYAKSQIYFTP